MDEKQKGRSDRAKKISPGCSFCLDVLLRGENPSPTHTHTHTRLESVGMSLINVAPSVAA